MDISAADTTKYAYHRAVFYPGFQKQFITDAAKNLKMSLRKLADHYSISSGFSYSAWKKFKREELLLPMRAVVTLCGAAGLDLGNVLLNIRELRDRNWGSIKGGKLGIRAVLDKYGESELQRRRINGANQQRGMWLARLIKKPPVDVELAEFIGVHLGDGTMTQNFLRITGDARYDSPYLSNYVSTLVSKLFAMPTKLYVDRNTLNVRVASRALCRYMVKRWGIPYGDKIRNRVTIPKTIVESKDLFLACVRGLVDTDGSISKDGSTISIRLHSSNPSLLESLVEGIKTHKLNFFSFVYEQSIGTHSLSKIENYFRTVGSSNLKHVVKFNEWHSRKKFVRTREVLDYFESYKVTPLPFYIKNSEGIMGPWSSG